MKPFQIKKDGKTYDYRLGVLLDQTEIRAYFEKLGYQVVKLWFGSRHEFGILQKNNKKFFIKMATTEGQSIVIENEIAWNQQMSALLSNNDFFCVPYVFETGKFQDEFVWEIMDYWEGEMLSAFPANKDTAKLKTNISLIIRIIRLIENLALVDLPLDVLSSSITPQERFLEKTKSWFEGIPQDVREKYQIKKLLEIVDAGSNSLDVKPRHGDFTPWHMFPLPNGKIGLFDAEHAMARSVENYDLCYLVQRVFSVLENSEFAKEIYKKAPDPRRSLPCTGLRGMDDRLKCVLAARAIGGFLDESLIREPKYKFHEEFTKWVLSF